MYKQMSDILSERKCGEYCIKHFEIKPDNLYAMLKGISPGKYVKLVNRGEIVMSDTGMERRTNEEFVRKAHGNVLIGGLGIGLVLLPVQEKQDVHKIVVIEKSQEVIDLVADQLPMNEKVVIVKADINDYVPKEKFNTIYFDIWNYINQDVYEQSMKPLLSKYRKYLVSKAMDSQRYIDCWCKYQAKNGIRI